jgi:hypothetical protein
MKDYNVILSTVKDLVGAYGKILHYVQDDLGAIHHNYT